jgi:hypothetical protein
MTKINGVVWKKREKGECHCFIFVLSFILCSSFLFLTMGEIFHFFCTWSLGGIIKHVFCAHSKGLFYICVLTLRYWEGNIGSSKRGRPWRYSMNHLVIKGRRLCPTITRSSKAPFSSNFVFRSCLDVLFLFLSRISTFEY